MRVFDVCVLSCTISRKHGIDCTEVRQRQAWSFDRMGARRRRSRLTASSVVCSVCTLPEMSATLKKRNSELSACSP